MPSNKILIVAPYQFGELSDCYYWAKYSSLAGYKVTYIGYKYKHRQLKERTLDGVNIVRVPHSSNRKILGLSYFLTIIFTIFFYNIDNVVLCRFPHCEIIPKIFRKRNIILDVRTLSVNPNEVIRNREDEQLRCIKSKFKKCSAISPGVGDSIGKPYELLPLGAESLSFTQKKFLNLKLFYIGGFTGRNLHVFLEGLGLLKQKYGLDFQFDLVGGGSPEVEKNLRDIVQREGLTKVCFHGYLNHEEASKFFDECNVGVCFVPVTNYYQNQPATKLYEYLLSGMVAISTDTKANIESMNSRNGMLIHDTKEDVCEGLYALYMNRSQYNSIDIVSDAQKYHWKNIVDTYFLKLFAK